MFEFIEQLPDADDYNRLRNRVGWNELDREVVSASLPRSLYCICARYKGEIIAFARIVGDGGICFYIQEIIVDPVYQKKGIASTLMKYIFTYFNKSAVKRSYLGVFAGKDLETFYSKFGFWKRPTGKMGPGMMQFWNDPEFNDRYNGD